MLHFNNATHGEEKMKQADLARALSVTPIWFNAVLRGRADAGKTFAKKASDLIGGGMEVWMLESRRKSREPLVEKYISAANQARREVKV